MTADTEAKCQAEAAAIKSGLKEKSTQSKDTLRTAIDDYIEKRKNRLSPSTLYVYRNYQKNRFQSAMDKPMSRVDWQKVIDSETVSPSAVRDAWLLASAAMNEKGFSPNVILPKCHKRDLDWLAPEQIPIFLEAIKGEVCEIPALLALHSLRRSEIFGLIWENVDLTNNAITVQGAVVIGEDGRFVRKETNKTAKSARKIPIMIPRLAELLSAQRRESGPVVTGAPNYAHKRINQICEEQNLPKVGFHGLRRSFASLGYSLRLSEKEIMSIGGWEKFETVSKFYLYLSERDLENAASKMTEFYTEKIAPAQKPQDGLKISTLVSWFKEKDLPDELLSDCLDYLFENANTKR